MGTLRQIRHGDVLSRQPFFFFCAKMAEQNLRQGNTITAPGIGSVLMDERLSMSPLAQTQTPPLSTITIAQTSPGRGPAQSKHPIEFFQEEATSRAERMAMFREQNAMIQARNMHVRDVFLENLRQERDRRSRQSSRDRSEKRELWNQRLRNSPFTVDLLAENERVDEELTVRTLSESKRLRVLKKKKARVKTDIILKALAETDDLAALRAEKRALVDEERKLRALRDLEKVGSRTINAEKRITDLRKARLRDQQNKRMLRRQRLQLEQPHLQALPIFQRGSTAPAHIQSLLAE